MIDSSSNFKKNFKRPCDNPHCDFIIPMEEMLVAVHEGDGYYNCPQCGLQIMRSLNRMTLKNKIHLADPNFNNVKEDAEISDKIVKPFRKYT